MSIVSQPSTYERTVIKIMRKLPPERVTQLVDFARFLEFQTTEQYDEWLDTEEVETEEAVIASEAVWDELLTRPDAKRMLRELAHEALQDYETGHTTEIAITEDGRLKPA